MTNITFGIDSISSRLDFSRALQDLFRDAGDQVSRSQDHLFLFLHCLMSETGFRLDAAEDNFWSQGYWKPEMGRRSCYSTCYKIQEIHDGKVTLRMTPVGSTLVIIASSEFSEPSANTSFSTSKIRPSEYIEKASRGDYSNLKELSFIFKETISRPLFAFVHHAMDVPLPKTYLTGLNEVVLMDILRRLRNAESLKALASTNKHMFKAIANNQSFWKALLLRDFPDQIYDEPNMKNYFVFKNSKKRI